VNIQGEEVMKLDEFANRTLYQALDHTGLLCVMASEEDENILSIPEEYPCGKYVLTSTRSTARRTSTRTSRSAPFSRSTNGWTRSATAPGRTKTACSPGKKQVCAGYLVYGSSTMLVYTTGKGVHGFTYDPSVGEFLMSHENIRIPKKGSIYSVNEGNFALWDAGTKAYIEHLRSEGPPGHPYKSRYIGSLVADFHRTLLYGGIFLYPADRKSPNGKLRLLYECAPLAFICEGGRWYGHRRQATDHGYRAFQAAPEIGTDHRQRGKREGVPLFYRRQVVTAARRGPAGAPVSTIAVPVLMARCRVSAKCSTVPMTSHTTITATASAKTQALLKTPAAAWANL